MLTTVCLSLVTNWHQKKLTKKLLIT